MKQGNNICERCNGQGSYEGKVGGSEGVPESDVFLVCNECGGTGKTSPSIPVNDDENNNLQKLADLLENRGVRKYLNINGFGYSQIERDIVELFQPAAQPIPVNDELDIPKGKWYFYDCVNMRGGEYGAGEWVQMELATKLSNKKIHDTASIGKMSFTALGGRNKPDHKKATNTMKAICTAVNETYGKGYNPAAMEELYKELADVIPVLQYKGDCETVIERIKTALHNAKTIKK